MRFKRIGSTNTRAYEVAEKGAREWTVVVSEVQTKGRGRSGKTWVSRRGGLWFSVILRPRVSPRSAGLLQILAAVAVRRAVEKESKTRVWLKWPNDLLLAGGKLGGILIETKTVADTLSFVVLGIGVNVNQTRRSLPKAAVSIFSARGRRVSLDRLLKAVLRELRRDYDRLPDASELASEWWQHCIHKQRTVQVESSQGIVRGVNVGVTPEGLLLVETGPAQRVSVADGSLRVLV